MRKQTAYLIIGIGIASILAGIYLGVKSEELIDALSGIIIGISLIGTVMIERNSKKESE
jgi:hypothetical protein